MKKRSILMLGLALCGFLLSACGGPAAPASQDPGADPSASAALSGVVNTNGSTSMEKVIQSLAEQFMAEHDGVTVNYDPTGSGTGIEAVSSGSADIGLSSRDLKDEEAAKGLAGTVVAKDGIVVIVNAENPVTDLSVEQIAGLATGEIANWKDVGGSDAPVVLIGREAGSGTRDGFESITGTGERCVYRQELTSTGGVIEAVKGNPNAFGYASLSAVEGKEGVTAVKVGGVECTEAAILDGSYAIARNFTLITKEGAPLSGTAQAFLDFAVSADAAGLIRGAGAVPVA